MAVDTFSDRLARVEPIVLDGGLSTELERRGADLRDALWSAKVLVETKQGSLVVPTEVVQPGLKGDFVYLAKEDQSVEARQVDAGMELEGMTVIEKGLQPGDRVVREGQNKLKPGAKISVKEAKL